MNNASLEFVYKQTYIQGNVGPGIRNFDRIFSDGISTISLDEIEIYYPTLTISDFSDRGMSSFTLAGQYFNLTNPSIQNPVTISQSSGNIGSTISVQKTTNFPTSGYLFTQNGGVVQYTGKTTTSFTGCSVYRGSTTLSVGTEIIPFVID